LSTSKKVVQMIWLLSGTLNVTMDIIERFVNIYDLAVRYWLASSWTLERWFIICACDILFHDIVFFHRTYDGRCHCEEHHNSYNGPQWNSGLGCSHARSAACFMFRSTFGAQSDVQIDDAGAILRVSQSF
jgi:hypothetical protein